MVWRFVYHFWSGSWLLMRLFIFIRYFIINDHYKASPIKIPQIAREKLYWLKIVLQPRLLWRESNLNFFSYILNSNFWLCNRYFSSYYKLTFYSKMDAEIHFSGTIYQARQHILMFVTHMETTPHWWRAANFDRCSVLMAIEQRGFFRVLRLLWHGASVYNGHLRGPVTPSPSTTHFKVITKFYSKNIKRNVEKTPMKSTRFLYTKSRCTFFLFT